MAVPSRALRIRRLRLVVGSFLFYYYRLGPLCFTLRISIPLYQREKPEKPLKSLEKRRVSTIGYVGSGSAFHIR